MGSEMCIRDSRQGAPGVKISERNFGYDRRYPITNGFRDAKGD